MASSCCKGLFVTTTYPAKIEKAYGIKGAEYIWLSNLGEKGAITPKALEKELIPKIEDFMRGTQESVIFIDHVESLYTDNKKKDFFKFMRWISSVPSTRNSTVLIPIDPEVLPRSDIEALSGMFNVIMDVRNITIESDGKECPRCGAIWNPNVTLCSICGYEFGISPRDTKMPEESPEKTTEPEITVKKDGNEKKKDFDYFVPPMEKEDFLGIHVEGPPRAGDHSPGSWFKKGVDFEKQGYSEKAIEAYTEALKIAPNDPWIWINMGVSYQRLAMSEEALRCYDNAIKLNPLDADAWSNRAIALRLMGKIEEAVKSYDRALAIDPGDAGIWSNKGVALRALGKVNEALDCYDQALAIDPYDVGTWLNKAVLLQRTGRIEESLKCYDEILRLDPYHPVAIKNKELLSRLH